MSRKPKYKKADEINQTNPDKLPPEQVQQIVDLVKNRPCEMVSTTEICPNYWNRNEMGTGFLSALEKNISNPRIGQTAPILITDNPQDHEMNGGEKYIIVDGYHRWLQCVKLGIKKIRAIYLKDITIDEAKTITLMQNRIRGVTHDINVHEAINEIDREAIEFDVHEAVNIENIQVNQYEPPPAPMPEPQPINTGSELGIPASEPGIIPQSVASEIKQETTGQQQVATEQMRATLPEERTAPLTIFPAVSDREIITDLISKLIEREKLDLNNPIHKGLIVRKALETYLDTEKIQAIVEKDEARQKRLQAEAEAKERRKVEKQIKKEQKAKEKAEKKKAEKVKKPHSFGLQKNAFKSQKSGPENSDPEEAVLSTHNYDQAANNFGGG